MEYPTKAAAKRAVDGLKLEINVEAISTRAEPLTVDQLIEHYMRTELSEASRKNDPNPGSLH